MPARPFTPQEMAAVESEFASRRGLRNVVLACDGTHCPFRPKSKAVSVMATQSHKRPERGNKKSARGILALGNTRGLAVGFEEDKV